MLLSDAQLLGSLGDGVVVNIISPEGGTFSCRFSSDTLVEQVKFCAIDNFFPNVTNEAGISNAGGGRYKLVRVSDASTLHDFFTLQREQVTEQDELLLVERGQTEAAKLWELGSVHAPAPAAILAATAGLAAPRPLPPHPDLQSLLTTNEVTRELQKILISLIEVGARLAAGGRNYEETLRILSQALDEYPDGASATTQGEVVSPPPSTIVQNSAPPSQDGSRYADVYKRAECIQKFLEKFKYWRSRVTISPMPEGVQTLKDLGFTEAQANLAFSNTGRNEPAAALWLVGERGSSLFELVNGLPEGNVLQSLLKQPVIQRGLLNTRMILAFISIVGRAENAALWLNAPHGGPLLQQILRTYHSEKYCSAVNQYTQRPPDVAVACTSRASQNSRS